MWEAGQDDTLALLDQVSFLDQAVTAAGPHFELFIPKQEVFELSKLDLKSIA